MQDAQQDKWQNRIVGYGSESPRALIANPKNFRTHPKHQEESLAGVLNEVGIVQNVIVNKRTGKLIDGHLRVELAKKEKQKEIPVTYVDLSESEEAEILATLDPISALATADREKLDALLRDVHAGDKAVMELLERLAVQEGLIPPVDFKEAWQGMPEFEQKDLLGQQVITVHFPKFDDAKRFAEILGLSITERTKSIWYPRSPEKAKYCVESA